MKKKVKIFGKDVKRAVRRGLMENIVEQYEMKDTYSKAKYKQSPKEAEIEGVFGQYGEDIPPAVLRYMRKNPKVIIKRLYDVYGQDMFDYISGPSNDDDMSDWSYEEEEVVAEEEQIAAKTAGTSYNFNKNPDDWEKFNKKVGDDSTITADAQGNVNVYAESITKKTLKNIFESKSGKGCADTKKGCVRKRGNKWIILNNKKGGVWKEGGEFDTKEEANEKLKAIHA